ncbi:MAG: hypothetical protein LIO75_08850 [Lachnospiraceae bacterium]|nr:hypothetical protein [Lachnospiraceae bacterium]
MESEDGDNWICGVDSTDLSNPGCCNIHIYLMDQSGNQYLVGAVTADFSFQEP